MRKKKKNFCGIREMCPICCFQVRIDLKTDQYIIHDTAGNVPKNHNVDICDGSGNIRLSALHTPTDPITKQIIVAI